MIAYILQNHLADIFGFLVTLALYMYCMLDGCDLGVGMLLVRYKSRAKRDSIIGSIAPFWDANETWLVLWVGLITIAFPQAHGEILGKLYIHVFMLLFLLILRGVSFELRLKTSYYSLWSNIFMISSFGMSFTMGHMIFYYISGFSNGITQFVSCCAGGMAFIMGFSALGEMWISLTQKIRVSSEYPRKIENDVSGLLYGFALFSMLAYAILFHEDEVMFGRLLKLGYYSAIPIMLNFICGFLAVYMQRLLYRWSNFLFLVSMFCFFAAFFIFSAMVVYPYISPYSILLVDGAAHEKSLIAILISALIFVPLLLIYTMVVHIAFRGKLHNIDY
ncbi:cytochrome bd ubiquinol oxidase I/II subunit 2 [Candidatus Fokinia solitaria]|uniref:Cytochrome bd ubiquinol oxidase I/II subunit 2 n=1 Tax=Candidatus Fokinia solitaria TaxID=1802984 RepID=A0A2U8BT64_9RICK|nr:cytochrome d ubiquinol oxidase subunit II [Candidatus Fokinia solitaria]AWD33508.1 cytochrome bd ubiquinol oxidase I/II subunit 2 [Candidatus Fokinia solitaria]